MAAEYGSARPALQIHATHLDGSVRLLVVGELDLAIAPELWEVSTDLLASVPPASGLVLDMGGVEFVDAAGLGAIVRLRNRLHAAGRSLRVEAPPSVRRVIALAGLDGLLQLEEAGPGGGAARMAPS